MLAPKMEINKHYLRKERRKGRHTEIHRMNREKYRYLRPEAENQQHFVAFVPPSSGIL